MKTVKCDAKNCTCPGSHCVHATPHRAEILYGKVCCSISRVPCEYNKRSSVKCVKIV